MAIEIVFQVQDASGTKGTTSVRVAGEPTLAGLAGFAVGWANALNNLIAGKIIGAAALIKANISGLTGNTIISVSDVEHVGKFEFLTAGGNRVKVNVPALAEQLLLATTSDDLNQSETNIAAFIAAMEDGINVGGALIQPCDLGEDDVVATIFAREAFRNSGARR